MPKHPTPQPFNIDLATTVRTRDTSRQNSPPLTHKRRLRHFNLPISHFAFKARLVIIRDVLPLAQGLFDNSISIFTPQSQ